MLVVGAEPVLYVSQIAALTPPIFKYRPIPVRKTFVIDGIYCDIQIVVIASKNIVGCLRSRNFVVEIWVIHEILKDVSLKECHEGLSYGFFSNSKQRWASMSTSGSDVRIIKAVRNVQIQPQPAKDAASRFFFFAFLAKGMLSRLLECSRWCAGDSTCRRFLWNSCSLNARVGHPYGCPRPVPQKM